MRGKPRQPEPFAEKSPAPEGEPSEHSGEPEEPIPGYRIIELLGRGGMGAVFKARDLKLGRTVALKFAVATPEAKARFQEAVRLAAGLHHPNIAPIFEAGEEQGRTFIAMEYGSGTLAGRLRENKQMGVVEAARLAEGLARGLAVAHSKGIVHRDLKPSNILLTSHGTPKIADFGQIRIVDFGLTESASDASAEKTVGAGTLRYMAPEQVAGGRVGPSTDLYSVGAILYEMLTDRPPAARVGGIMRLGANTSLPEAPSRLRSDVPPDLDDICLRCLEPEPSRRFASAGELAQALHELEFRPKAGEISPATAAMKDVEEELPNRIDDDRAPTETTECLLPYEVEEFAETGHLPAGRLQHVKQCLACEALLAASRIPQDGDDPVIDRARWELAAALAKASRSLRGKRRNPEESD